LVGSQEVAAKIEQQMLTQITGKDFQIQISIFQKMPFGNQIINPK